MQQMNTEGLNTIDLALLQDDLPESVRLLRPVLWQEGDHYCCLLGADRQTGVFGTGKSPESAMLDWDRHLSERLAVPDQHDEFSIELRRLLEKNFR
jgi:hypothetical protein